MFRARVCMWLWKAGLPAAEAEQRSIGSWIRMCLIVRRISLSRDAEWEGLAIEGVEERREFRGGRIAWFGAGALREGASGWGMGMCGRPTDKDSWIPEAWRLWYYRSRYWILENKWTELWYGLELSISRGRITFPILHQLYLLLFDQLYQSTNQHTLQTASSK